MTIQVICPNQSCGRSLTVPQAYAGRKGKCPACDAELIIPQEAGVTPAPLVRPPTPPHGGEQDDHANSEKAVLPPVEPARLETENGALPRPVLAVERNHVPRSLQHDNRAARVGLVSGIVCLVLLSLAPVLNWHHVARGGEIYLVNVEKAHGSGADIVIPVYSVAVVLLALGALIVCQGPWPQAADAVLPVCGGFGLGWCLTAGVWMVAHIWKVIKVSSDLAKNFSPPPGSSFLGGSGDAEFIVLPGIGLWLGLLAALVGSVAFGYVLLHRKRLDWLIPTVVLGLVVGLLLLVHVKPWQGVVTKPIKENNSPTPLKS
jgi:hypothetical protein